MRKTATAGIGVQTEIVEPPPEPVPYAMNVLKHRVGIAGQDVLTTFDTGAECSMIGLDLGML